MKMPVQYGQARFVYYMCREKKYIKEVHKKEVHVQMMADQPNRLTDVFFPTVHERTDA